MRQRLLILPLVALALVGCADQVPPAQPSSPDTSAAATPVESSSPTPGVGKVGAYQVRIPVDGGPRQYAMGTVQLDGQGIPASYQVVADDLATEVAARFGFPDAGYLVTINAVRRGTTLVLYVGDTLNLSASTIASVGDVNGQVLSEAMPVTAPDTH